MLPPKAASSAVSGDDDKQAGCWPNLFRHRRKEKAASSSSKQDIPERIVRSQDSAELPSYTTFAHGWYRWDSGRPTVTNKDWEQPPAYAEDEGVATDVVQTIEETLNELSPKLRRLSLDIWEHPELAFEEKYAHDRLTGFMASHGFTITPNYLGVTTAWRAVFTHPSSDASKKARRRTRVIGVNSEMDALPRIGHGCGHNLIAMSGAAVAIAIKTALQKHDVPGTVVLLGTPAEESGGGKILLLERGAYDEMDACIMSHPSSGPDKLTALWPGIACQPIEVEFFGHGAHAAAAPWEAQNALDAAFVAYASISALRQQLRPEQRINGIIVGRDWTANVIPDYAKMLYIVRTPTWADMEVLRERVIACFDAAAIATACKIDVKLSAGYMEVKNNDVLGQQYARVVKDRYGMPTNTDSQVGYSTDFGNVTFALPALHPVYTIPTEPDGSNHTPQFAKSAATHEAHEATLRVAAGLAATGFRVLQDPDFADKAKKSFEESKANGSA